MFHDRGGQLCVDEVPLNELADRYGTPLYVYSRGQLKSAYSELRGLFPADVKLLYSLKANSNPTIASVLRELGAGAEIASLGELQIAKRAGFNGPEVAFAGPGKRDTELSAALDFGVGSVNVESLNEGKRLSQLAVRAGRRATVCLRINPQEYDSGARMQMGGQPLAFGVDEEVAPDVLRELSRLPQLDLVGVHLYSGTQVLKVDGVTATVRTGFRLGQLFAEALGRPPELLELGLGLGVPLFQNERALPLDALASALADLLPQLPPGSRLAVESGRFLVARAGVYVSTVIDVKESRGTRFVVLDGGMHHHVSAAGGFGNFYRRAFPTRAVATSSAEPSEVSLAGPCCTSLDQFGQNVPLAPVAVGDRVAVLQSGAYGLSVSPLLFLSHATPAEVLVEGSQVQLIRRPQPTSDLLP